MKLYFDCDGVLADFDKLANSIFGMDPQKFEDEFGSKEFWKKLEDHGDFFFKLELMPDAKKMWKKYSFLKPTILTGCPRGNWAQPQKVRWAKKHLMTDRIITCASRDKKLHGQPGDVLVDDLLKYRHLWEEMGGTFIHHTSVENTIVELDKIYRRS